MGRPTSPKAGDFDPNSPFEPGKYDTDKGFGAGAKVNKMQPPRPEKPQESPPDEVDTEKARKATSCRSPSYAFATKPYEPLTRKAYRKNHQPTILLQKKNIKF